TAIGFAQGPAGGPPPGAPAGPGGPGGQRGGPGGGRGGQARDPQAQAAQVGTGSIAGVVTLNGSASPVRHAQVTLNGGAGGGRGVGRSTSTNDQGRFSFVGLPAGRFTLNVSKPGYVGISYGAKKPGRQGTPIQLAEGQAL